MQICRRLQLAGRAGIVEESPVPTSRLILATTKQKRGQQRAREVGRRQDTRKRDDDATVAAVTSM